mgnify:FL=1
MPVFTQRRVKCLLLVAMSMAMFGTVAYAGGSKESVLNEYETHGFQCLVISQTINEDTIKAYTDLTALESSDKVHVCVRTDLDQRQITGNKYVFVFDQNDSMKTYNQIPSILD